jgi:tetratricopeptide (TPR) repeat protein
VKLLEAAERTSPDDVEVLLYPAELYRKSDQEERAVPLYQRAIRLDRSQLTASVGLGAIFFEREQYNEAIRHWEDALSKNSGLVLVGTNLAMAQWRVGNRQAAEATLRRVIDLSPGFQPAVDLLRRFRIERGQ